MTTRDLVEQQIRRDNLHLPPVPRREVCALLRDQQQSQLALPARPVALLEAPRRLWPQVMILSEAA